MSASNPLNVYTGRDSLVKYYDPDFQPPVPLVEIPDRLNPFRQDGVRIYAKMMSCLPANNVKSMPALNMLQKGVTPQTKRIVEFSSGSTVISMALIARTVHGIDDVHAYASNKTSEPKLKLLRFFGLNLTLFGGPAQPDPTDSRGGIWRAKTAAQGDDGILNPDQYNSPDNPAAHGRWTAPQIMAQLPHINVFATGMGTSGTLAGIGAHIKKTKPSVTIVGVCTAAGDRVPGPRSKALLSDSFAWSEIIDTIEEIESPPSFLLSLQLSREGLICGPSSGLNLKGLLNFLEKRNAAGKLNDLAGEDGEIHCVFLCCDLPYQHMDEYYTKLGEEHFPPITNKNLHKVDLYRYDGTWELEPVDAFARLYQPADTSYDSGISDSDSSDSDLDTPKYKEKALKAQPDVMVLDLRATAEFNKWHLPDSINLPLSSSRSGTDAPSPFDDPKLLEEQWLELDKIFSPEGTPFSAALLAGLQRRFVTLVCSDGDTARIASSVLRAKGIEASSIAGGVRKMRPMFRSGLVKV
ncbi:cysteine synthase B [Tricharina praecox]|uniref:cysteine synthase B n=1 Tax=Tricharina praecox TaxID=43433 RepID=UPI0022202643|nr:cysteine synthase B [Tricharina praecox]KAI5854974.1 cysteine synthase B [Tricharina praecox]